MVTKTGPGLAAPLLGPRRFWGRVMLFVAAVANLYSNGGAEQQSHFRSHVFEKWDKNFALTRYRFGGSVFATTFCTWRVY